MLAALAFLAVQLPAYSATIVPFAPNEVARCTDLNDRGEVVGFTGENDFAVGFWWKDGLKQPIQAPNGGGVFVRAINNDGTAIGFTRSGSLEIGFRWSRETGLMKFMDKERELMPMAIADGDTVAGVLYDVPTRSDVVGVWRPNATFQILSVVRGERGVEATGINRAGTVVGHPEERPLHAFVMTPGKERRLLEGLVVNPQAKGREKFSESIGSSINNGGMVTGWYRKGQAEVGCVWSPDGKRMDVGEGVYLREINDAGMAVGSRSTGDAINPSVAVIWDRSRGVRDLNTLVALDKTRLIDARAVNNRGEILCSGASNGSSYWFLLKPA